MREGEREREGSREGESRGKRLGRGRKGDLIKTNRLSVWNTAVTNYWKRQIVVQSLSAPGEWSLLLSITVPGTMQWSVNRSVCPGTCRVRWTRQGHDELLLMTSRHFANELFTNRHFANGRFANHNFPLKTIFTCIFWCLKLNSYLK